MTVVWDVQYQRKEVDQERKFSRPSLNDEEAGGAQQHKGPLWSRSFLWHTCGQPCLSHGRMLLTTRVTAEFVSARARVHSDSRISLHEHTHTSSAASGKQ